MSFVEVVRMLLPRKKAMRMDLLVSITVPISQEYIITILPDIVAEFD